MELLAPEKNTVQLTGEPSYHISVNDRGIIEIAFFGVQTDKTIQPALDALKPVMADLRQRGQPVNILADNKQVIRTTTAANQLVLKAYKAMDFHKAAGINANPFIRFVLNSIIGAARLTGKVKLFHDRATAEQWLLHP